MTATPRPRLDKGPVAAAAVVVLVFAVAAIEALSFTTTAAKTVPLTLSLLIVVMGVGVLFRELRGTGTRSEPELATDDDTLSHSSAVSDAPGALDNPDSEPGVGLSAVTVWLVVAALAVLVLVLGSQLGTAIFLVLALRFVYHASWRRTVITLVVFVLVFGWAWVNLLNQPVYEGLLLIPAL